MLSEFILCYITQVTGEAREGVAASCSAAQPQHKVQRRLLRDTDVVVCKCDRAPILELLAAEHQPLLISLVYLRSLLGVIHWHGHTVY